MKDAAAEFFIDLANVKDEHLHVMRGHLLIEQKLRELIDLKVKRPDALSDARLTFNQIVCIAESFYWEKYSDWLWQGIRKLNNIRNSFSHQLEQKNYEKIVKEFIGICRDNNTELSGRSRIILAMCSVYTRLDAYIQAPI